MNKAEFIAELSDRLAILTEEERQDILDEYEQHIDMKVMRGMSEEAAITDFGKIEELTADILEAYHVRADYANADNKQYIKRNRIQEKFRKKTADRNQLNAKEIETDEEASAGHSENNAQTFTKIHKKIWHKTKHICSRIWDFCKKVSSGFFKGIKHCGKTVRTGIANLIIFCRKPFQKRAIKNQEIEETVLAEEMNLENKQAKEKIGMQRRVKMRSRERFSITKAVARTIAYIVRSCVAAVCWCLQWFWNLFWGGAGILFGFGSCLMIFVMGMLTVLRIQGYPLTGIMIGGLGLTLCMVSVTIGCFSLIAVKKTRNTGKKADEKTVDEMENYFTENNGIESSSIENYSTSEQPSEIYTEELLESSKKSQELLPVVQEEEYN